MLSYYLLLFKLIFIPVKYKCATKDILMLIERKNKSAQKVWFKVLVYERTFKLSFSTSYAFTVYYNTVSKI